MARWISLSVIFVLLMSSSFVYGQDHINDRGIGTTNHNYFVASYSPELQNLIAVVEATHLFHCPHSPGGVIADIRQLRFNDGIGDLKYILARFVNHPKALQLMGTIARLTKKQSLAIPYYEKAISLYPMHALTHAQYGAYLADIGQVYAGIAKLEKAIEMDSKLIAAYVWIARAYHHSGKLELARQASQQARELGYKGKISGELSAE